MFVKTLLVFFVFILFSGANAVAQVDTEKCRTGREVEMRVDNDFLFIEDYYYTAGQDLFFRKLANPRGRLFKMAGGNKGDSAKVILQYRYGIKIFTPTLIESSNTRYMDRPYAGWNFASVGVSSFPTATTGNHYEAEIGMVGKMSGMGQLQHWIHKMEAYEAPKGWGTQINNELVVNMYYSRFQNWKLAEEADVVSQSSVQAGTGGNKISQELTLRLVQFNPINNSAYTQSRLSWSSSDKKEEAFIFAGFSVDYVVSNIFIEGSLFKQNQSIFTIPAERWVFNRRIGIMYSSRRVSWGITGYHLSKEIRKGTAHNYLGLNLAVRF